MQSAVRKRSIIIGSQKTSVSLEEEFWISLKKIAKEQNLSVSQLVASIDKSRSSNLSSALRLHVLAHYRDRLAAE